MSFPRQTLTPEVLYALLDAAIIQLQMRGIEPDIKVSVDSIRGLMATPGKDRFKIVTAYDEFRQEQMWKVVTPEKPKPTRNRLIEPE